MLYMLNYMFLEYLGSLRGLRGVENLRVLKLQLGWRVL